MNERHAPLALSWSSHALLTRYALQPLAQPRLQERTVATDLEDFLERAQSELPDLIRWYWHLLDRRAGTTNRTDDSPPRVLTASDFLAEMQLNRKIALQYAALPTPEETGLDFPHDTRRDGPPGRPYVHTPFGTDISALEILFTYSDEPDWGMDQDLYARTDHRYGGPPFGMSTGVGSQVPFHMAFYHENPLLVRLVPALRRSFLEERIRVCFALAELAFKTGVNYWGWRFTAWATHYLQDITAPYHARAFPPAIIPTARHLILHRDPRSGARRIGAVLKNHHVFFEFIIHLLLNEAVKKQPDHLFLQALKAEEGMSHSTLDAIVIAASRAASMLAPEIDRKLVLLLRDRHVDDTDYTNDPDALGRSFEFLRRAVDAGSAPVMHFLDLVAVCLTHTGWVTRYAVRRVCSPPAC